MTRIRSHLTYANVVATLALCAALATGGAYAATQLGKDSVGPKQIRKGAVRSQDLGDGGVKTRDLAKQVRARLAVTERASVAGDGSLRAGTAAGVERSDPSNYTVTFRRSVARCSYAATLATSGTGEPDSGGTRVSGSGGNEVTITTFDSAGSAVPAGFDLLVIC